MVVRVEKELVCRLLPRRQRCRFIRVLAIGDDATFAVDKQFLTETV